jgi:hypothetical protein
MKPKHQILISRTPGFLQSKVDTLQSHKPATKICHNPTYRSTLDGIIQELKYERNFKPIQ